MSQKDQVKAIIGKVWRVQYRALGEGSISKLYEAVQDKKPLDELLTSAEGGNSFDLHSAWQLMYEAVDLTVNVLALYTIWKQKHDQPPTRKEILQLLREAKIENAYSRAVLDRLDTLIDQVAEK